MAYKILNVLRAWVQMSTSALPHIHIDVLHAARECFLCMCCSTCFSGKKKPGVYSQAVKKEATTGRYKKLNMFGKPVKLMHLSPHILKLKMFLAECRYSKQYLDNVQEARAYHFMVKNKSRQLSVARIQK